MARKLALLIGSALIGASASAQVHNGAITISPPYSTPPLAHSPDVPSSVLFRSYVRDMRSLRERALSLQATDGGALTPEHRDMVQAKLDRIQTGYKRAVCNNSAYSPIDRTCSGVR